MKDVLIAVKEDDIYHIIDENLVPQKLGQTDLFKHAERLQVKNLCVIHISDKKWRMIEFA